MTKMRKGQSHSFNNWLRVRIIAQGLTIAAVVAGSWAYTSSSSRPPSELDASAAQDKAALERVAFEDRLRLAEEITRAESGSTSDTRQGTTFPTTEIPSSSTTSGSGSWQLWRGWSRPKDGTDKPS